MLCDRHVSEPPNAPNISATPLLEKVGAEHRLHSIDPNDPLRRLRRQVVADMDFEAQREEAPTTLRRFGVLQ
jgi:hypothetical protein